MRHLPRMLLVAFLIGLLLIPMQTAYALTYTVTTSDDELDADCNTGTIADFGTSTDISLHEALCLANQTGAADVIDFNVTDPTVDFTPDPTFSRFFLTSNLTIDGTNLAGTGEVIVNSTNNRHFLGIVYDSPNVTIQNITIQNFGDPTDSWFTYGGAILFDPNNNVGTLTIDNVNFIGNIVTEESGEPPSGGAIYARDGTVSISNSSFTGNGALVTTETGYISAYGGAIAADNLNLTIENTSFSNNSVIGSNSVVDSENSGDGVGGAIAVADPVSFILTASSFTGNTATGGDCDSLTLECTSRALGGALAIDSSGSAAISGTTFSDNHAVGGANLSGGPYVGGDAIGGAIWNEANLLIIASSITSNSALGTGVNPGFGWGGGVYNGGELQIVDTTISGNSANIGGGIHNGPTVTNALLDEGEFDTDETELYIRHSLISGNTATWAGAGIANLYSALDIFNTTIANNNGPTVMVDVGGGGGIYATESYITLFFVTVSGNLGDEANGIVSLGNEEGTETYIANSLFWNVADNCDVESLNEDGINMVPNTDTSCGSFTQIADAMLQPLGNYGGPTLTMALAPTSPAVDRAECDFDEYFPYDESALDDQRHFFRPIDIDGQGNDADDPSSELCDVGAYEVQIQPIVTVYKEAQGPVNLPFSFEITDNDEFTYPFDLTDNDAGTNPYMVLAVDPGTYDINETTVVTDYALADITCEGSGLTSSTNHADPSLTGVEVVLADSAIVTCTFTNIETATITIEKDTGGAPSGTFGIQLAVSSVDGVQPDYFFDLAGGDSSGATNVLPGTYNLTEETLASGWLYDRIECPDLVLDEIENGVEVPLESGDDLLCIVYNLAAPSSGGGGSTPGGNIVVSDPALSKTGLPENATVGESVTWLIVVTNTGITQQDNVVITDDVPDQFDIVSATATQGTVDVNGQSISANLGTLLGGGTATITINTVANDSALPGSICNTAYWDTTPATDCVTFFPDALPPTGGPSPFMAVLRTLIPLIALLGLAGLGGYALTRRKQVH